MSNLFSADAKPPKSHEIDTNNCIYHFKCLCLSNYVGMTGRKIRTRAKEHRNFSTAKGIYYHIHSCPNYLERLRNFERENFLLEQGVRARQKIRDKFYFGHFSVLQRGFKNYFERRKTEAFFIRILRPDLNEQNSHRYFTLFWCGQFFKNFQPTLFISRTFELALKKPNFTNLRIIFAESFSPYFSSVQIHHSWLC